MEYSKLMRRDWVRICLKLAVLAVGIYVGLQHLKVGAKAWFTARNDEPAAFWLAIYAGPLCTLPASITAFFNERVGGWWLICGAFLFYIGAMGALGPEATTDNAIWFLSRWSAPMIAIGLAFLFLAKRQDIVVHPAEG